MALRSGVSDGPRFASVHPRLPTTGNCIASFCVIVSVGGFDFTLRQAPATQQSVAVSSTAGEACSGVKTGRRATSSSSACARGAGEGVSYSSVSVTVSQRVAEAGMAEASIALVVTGIGAARQQQ